MVGGRQGAPDFDRHRLRAARIAKDMTVAELAEAVGMNVSTIREWEAGRQVPRVGAVRDAAEALDIAPSDLLAHDVGSTLTLQQLRAATGKSQLAIATAAGMLRNTYSAIERGETEKVSYEDTRALARAFRVPVPQILDARAASRSAYLAQGSRHDG